MYYFYLLLIMIQIIQFICAPLPYQNIQDSPLLIDLLFKEL